MYYRSDLRGGGGMNSCSSALKAIVHFGSRLQKSSVFQKLVSKVARILSIILKNGANFVE